MKCNGEMTMGGSAGTACACARGQRAATRRCLPGEGNRRRVAAQNVFMACLFRGDL